MGEARRGETSGLASKLARTPRVALASYAAKSSRWLATNSSFARTLHVSCCLFSSLTTQRVCTPQGEGFVKLVNPSVAAARQRTSLCDTASKFLILNLAERSVEYAALSL